MEQLDVDRHIDLLRIVCLQISRFVDDRPQFNDDLRQQLSKSENNRCLFQSNRNVHVERDDEIDEQSVRDECDLSRRVGRRSNWFRFFLVDCVRPVERTCFCFVDVLELETGDPITNMTFIANYQQLEQTDQLKFVRVLVYNYLLSVGMPMTSDITLWDRQSDRVQIFSKTRFSLI